MPIFGQRPGSLFRGLTAIVLSGWLASTVLAADHFGSFRDVEQAYLTGKINRSQMLVEQATLFFQSPTLAAGEKRAPDQIIKSGTGLVREILDNWDAFAAEQKAVLSGYLSRPGTALSYDSPGGFFKIHYNTTGPEAVPPQDANGNSIPDYVERISQYCDSSRAVLQGRLGYYPPPSDKGVGGDDKYDIYLLSISGYGATIPEAAGDSAWDDFSSFIMIHYTMYGFPSNDDPQGDTIGAQKVSCAHEYYHATQFAYDRYEALWWIEASATWAEEIVFPDVNDNYNYLPYFYAAPETTLTSTTGLHMYGAFVWPGFLEQRFDSSVTLKIWRKCRYFSVLDATDSILAPYGSSVKKAFPEFTLWNHYTGYHAVPNRYFDDAGSYPSPDVDQIFSTLAHDSIVPISGPDGLACNYVRLAVDPSARGVLEIKLSGNQLARWALTGIISRGLIDTVMTGQSPSGNPISLYLPFIEDYDTVLAIPAVTSAGLTNNHYLLKCALLPYADANFDRAVNVGDATYLINYIFKGGQAPQPVWESGDADCDGHVNLGDAIYIVNYVFRGGPSPCAGRATAR